MEVNGQHQATAALAPENDPAAIVQEPGRVTGLGWTGSENFSLAGIRSPDRPARSELLH
jgi:hypothetical protein